MKTMLLSAAIVGTAIAALILYNQQQSKPKNRIEDAAKDAYDTMNEAIGSVERPMQHAMG
ncbi:MAG: hypothetical protein EOO52_20475 [Gammaproteobacteria bacterium]|nr:MAG: hypothetical protein EOO52_20475 [Gammaproteobacteria bacterium]